MFFSWFCKHVTFPYTNSAGFKRRLTGKLLQWYLVGHQLSSKQSCSGWQAWLSTYIFNSSKTPPFLMPFNVYSLPYILYRCSFWMSFKNIAPIKSAFPQETIVNKINTRRDTHTCILGNNSQLKVFPSYTSFHLCCHVTFRVVLPAVAIFSILQLALSVSLITYSISQLYLYVYRENGISPPSS